MKFVTNLVAAVALLASPAVFAQETADPGAPKTPAQGEQADSPAKQAPLLQASPGTAGASALPSDRLSGGFVSEQQPGELMASDLVGLPVDGRDGSDLGDVDDILIGADGRIAALVITTGEQGSGEGKLLAVPLDQVTKRVENNEVRLTVSIDAAAVAAAKPFEPLAREASMDDNQDLTTGSGAKAQGGSTPPDE